MTMAEMTGWIYPAKDRVLSEKRQGSTPRNKNAPPRVVLHTTEMVSRNREAQERSFRNHPHPPHLWVSMSQLNSAIYIPSGSSRIRNGRQPGVEGHDTFLQRIPLHKTAYALLNTSDPGETNHQGKYCIQVEIEGYAADAGSWGDDILTKLAANVLVPIGRWLRANGYPDWLYKPYREVGAVSGAYGKRGVARITQREWQTLAKTNGDTFNLLTHQEVPENKHWDCGALKLGKLAGIANVLLDGDRTSPALDTMADEVERHLRRAQEALDRLKGKLQE